MRNKCEFCDQKIKFSFILHSIDSILDSKKLIIEWFFNLTWGFFFKREFLLTFLSNSIPSVLNRHFEYFLWTNVVFRLLHSAIKKVKRFLASDLSFFIRANWFYSSHWIYYYIENIIGVSNHWTSLLNHVVCEFVE